MDAIEALILGLIQGLTEYLPVSSSGHLEIGKAILGPDAKTGGLTFDIIVHVATVLSTLVVLWKEVSWLFTGLFKFKLNDETKYIFNIVVSMIPVAIVGLVFKDDIEALFEGNVLLVTGICLMVTALLLGMTHFYKPQPREKISTLHAFIIGLSQAVAVLPGLSRSGTTIATGLLLGNSRQTLAQFSFLMVIPPILGGALIDFKDLLSPSAEYIASHGTEAPLPLASIIVGFIAAFVSGCIACKWMIALVKRCKLIYFAIYCAVVSLCILTYQFFG